jgi:hypothetical protein
MMHLFDRASRMRAHKFALDFDPQLHRLLTERIAALVTPYGDLTDRTEVLIVQPCDLETDIVRQIGFSPLVEPFDGIRYGELGFWPHWDWLVDRGGWYEMSASFGSTFAYVLFIEKADGVIAELLQLCAQYAMPIK